MKTLHFSITAIFSIIFIFSNNGVFADNTNNVEIQNIQVQPSEIKVGDPIRITATLVNNSTYPIFVSDMGSKDCQGPFFTIVFDNHVKVTEKEIACSYVTLEERLDPDKKYTGTSPGLSFTYIATESGTANTTVTFPYQIKNQTDPTQPNIGQTISKSFLFTILDNSTDLKLANNTKITPQNESPLKQFMSGIKPEYVKCNQDLHLIIKAEDGSFACVKIETAKDLLKRGWATTFGTGMSPNDYYTKCDTLFPQSNTGTAILYMPTNSIGKICMRYHNLNNTPTGVGMRIFEANNLTKNASNVTAWTDDSTLEGNANKTIVYFIKTGTKVGFYGVSLNCGGFPFAVGYDINSTITASDFPWIGRAFHCGVITYDSHIEGTAGIGVKYIPYP